MATTGPSLSKWVSKELVKLLGIAQNDVEDLSAYLVTIDNAEELTGFVTELLSENGSESGLDGPKKQFIRDLLERWERVRVPDNVMVYKKDDEFGIDKKMTGKKLPSANTTNPFDMSNMKEGLGSPEKKTKKKTSYVSLYGKDGQMRTDTVIIPGRNICECQAQKHSLVNNCLSCGRVVCEQEGSGPCLFCGNLVCTKEEKEVLARKSNKSEKLHKKLMSVEGGGVLNNTGTTASNIQSALEKARAYKERLLKYDRSFAKRTKVIDDETDYYSTDSNIWLSERERNLLKKKEEEIREKKHGSRLNRKVTLDIASRKVVDDESFDYDATKDAEIMAANFGHLSNETESDLSEDVSNSKENFPEIANPNIKGPAPTYLTEVAEKVEKTINRVWKGSNKRLQDEQLLMLSDPGVCLSMHQPWASLLVKGIKRHEGRSWYSNHRGRLWIAAAAKKPSDAEIAAVEEQHKMHWQATDGLDAMPEFPKQYPTGCLLGCVQVKEVLSQKEYCDKYPNGESGGAFVFVCENPTELKLLFPVKGKHKIWKIDPKTHLNAKRGLNL